MQTGDKVGHQMAQVAAIVLAAGRSSRMGPQNKLIADIAGKPMVRRVAETALASAARPVLVVTGHMAAEVGAALSGLDVTPVANPDYATGLASSLKAGIRAVPAGCDGALVLLGDMPRISPEVVGALLEAHAGAPERIVVPVHESRQGNPIIWPRRYFTELLQLEGDAGAKRLIAAHRDAVCESEIATDAIFVDVDTPEALRGVRGERT